MVAKPKRMPQTPNNTHLNGERKLNTIPMLFFNNDSFGFFFFGGGGGGGVS